MTNAAQSDITRLRARCQRCGARPGVECRGIYGQVRKPHRERTLKGTFLANKSDH